jgi:hypothetical protein
MMPQFNNPNFGVPGTCVDFPALFRNILSSGPLRCIQLALRFDS